MILARTSGQDPGRTVLMHFLKDTPLSKKLDTGTPFSERSCKAIQPDPLSRRHFILF
jgi:hypothetical protein